MSDYTDYSNIDSTTRETSRSISPLSPNTSAPITPQTGMGNFSTREGTHHVIELDSESLPTQAQSVQEQALSAIPTNNHVSDQTSLAGIDLENFNFDDPEALENLSPEQLELLANFLGGENTALEQKEVIIDQRIDVTDQKEVVADQKEVVVEVKVSQHQTLDENLQGAVEIASQAAITQSKTSYNFMKRGDIEKELARSENINAVNKDDQLKAFEGFMKGMFELTPDGAQALALPTTEEGMRDMANKFADKSVGRMSLVHNSKGQIAGVRVAVHEAASGEYKKGNFITLKIQNDRGELVPVKVKILGVTKISDKDYQKMHQTFINHARAAYPNSPYFIAQAPLTNSNESDIDNVDDYIRIKQQQAYTNIQLGMDTTKSLNDVNSNSTHLQPSASTPVGKSATAKMIKLTQEQIEEIKEEIDKTISEIKQDAKKLDNLKNTLEFLNEEQSHFLDLISLINEDLDLLKQQTSKASATPIVKEIKKYIHESLAEIKKFKKLKPFQSDQMKNMLLEIENWGGMEQTKIDISEKVVNSTGVNAEVGEIGQGRIADTSGL